MNLRQEVMMRDLRAAFRRWRPFFVMGTTLGPDEVTLDASWWLAPCGLSSTLGTLTSAEEIQAVWRRGA